LNDFAEKEKDIVKILKYATSAYAALGIEDPDEDDDDDDLGNEELFVPVAEQPRVSNEEYEQANEFEKFRQQYEARGLVTNAQAASRIFSDLRQLWKTGKDFGFHAEPFKDNLYKWNVTFFNFEKDTELYKDVGEYKRKTGRDTLDFIMDFPPEYPFKPPFIRALRPRFAFHTGHITIGGSVCMELLTTSGWSAANSVESILIQIRTEITAGGGRIDFSDNRDYSDAEAKAAFARVAQYHGWEPK
jgi:ubiquitin-conjugating enzyme E2 Q